MIEKMCNECSTLYEGEVCPMCRRFADKPDNPYQFSRSDDLEVDIKAGNILIARLTEQNLSLKAENKQLRAWAESVEYLKRIHNAEIAAERTLSAAYKTIIENYLRLCGSGALGSGYFELKSSVQKAFDVALGNEQI